MNSILEQFWHFYLSEHPYETDPAAHAELDEVLKREDTLRKTFSPEQTEQFFAYNEAVGIRQASAERAAFLCGVRCAVAFLLEAIQ